MSRSALNRSLRLRQREGTLEFSADPFAILIGIEPQEEAAGELGLRIHGSERTFNFDGVLASSIVSHEYFRYTLLEFTTLDEWLEEAERVVTHLQPFELGMDRRTPSRAFFLVFLLGVMRVTREQLLTRILGHKTNVFIRALGCLYLRFCWAPGDLWQWYEPLLSSSEWFAGISTPLHDIALEEQTRSHTSSSSLLNPTFRPWGENLFSMSFKKWLKGLIVEYQYGVNGYPETVLPRIPVVTQREMWVQIELIERDIMRGKYNSAEGKFNRFVLGAAINARFSGDGRMYPAVILKIIEPNEDGGNGKCVTFLVKYEGFEGEDSTEIRELGHLELLGSNDDLDSLKSGGARVGGAGGGGGGGGGGGEVGKKRVRQSDGDENDQEDFDEDEVDAIRRKVLDRERSKAVGGWKGAKAYSSKRYEDDDGKVPKTTAPQPMSVIDSNHDSDPPSVVIFSTASVNTDLPSASSALSSTAPPPPYVPAPSFLALLARYSGGSTSAEIGPEEAKRDEDNVRRHAEDVLVTEDVLPAN